MKIEIVLNTGFPKQGDWWFVFLPSITLSGSSWSPSGKYIVMEVGWLFWHMAMEWEF